MLFHSNQEYKLLEIAYKKEKKLAEYKRLYKKVHKVESEKYSNPIAVEAARNPEALIKTYIRKKFETTKEHYFGYIAAFDDPYYLVAYADGDFEDLPKQETMKCLWRWSGE